MKMVLLVMMEMMMMIPMKSSSMTVTMATISPLREGISPAESCLPESLFFSGVLRPAEAAAVKISNPPCIRVLESLSTRKGCPGGGPGQPPHA